MFVAHLECLLLLIGELQNHSEVPEKDEDWPTINDILAFRDRVRARLERLYKELQTGQRSIGRRLARTLMMTLEHEGFHIEVASVDQR
jgi:hypothetical protein